MERVVDIREAKTHLSRLVARAEAGEEITLARAGKPVARLVPYTPRREPRKLGIWKGKIRLAEDWDSAETNAGIARLFDAWARCPGVQRSRAGE
jgi:prevent-host-death family protein